MAIEGCVEHVGEFGAGVLNQIAQGPAGQGILIGHRDFFQAGAGLLAVAAGDGRPDALLLGRSDDHRGGAVGEDEGIAAVGHVDGVGVVRYMAKDARSIYIEIELPGELMRYTADKGSITVDGISLTTNLVKDNIVCLNIIPHTAEVTNIGRHWKVGGPVNIEVDLIARYLERLTSVAAE